jgi:hypothetical protein
MLKFLSEAEAEKLFEETLIQWRRAYNYRGCSTVLDTMIAVQWATAWAWRSPTAQDLMKNVRASEKTIYVVGMRGGFQCFNSTEGPKQDMPVVFIDVQGKLTANVRTEHDIVVDNQHVPPESCTNGVFEINNNIAILHEFGHAMQWIERPLLFDNHFKKAEGSDGKSFREAIRAQATKINPKGGLQTEEEYKAYKPITAWGVVIEMDNMSRHEWPICKELGLPRRVNYRDINATSEGPGTATSQIVAKAREAEERERVAKANAEAAKGLAKNTESTCPRCKKSFKSKILLRAHEPACTA